MDDISREESRYLDLLDLLVPMLYYWQRAVKGWVDVESYIRVERQPFLASKAVIFGVNPIGPHIRLVKLCHGASHLDASSKSNALISCTSIAVENFFLPCKEAM
jgi:hypothetical protein